MYLGIFITTIITAFIVYNWRKGGEKVTPPSKPEKIIKNPKENFDGMTHKQREE
mgnify:CR=1 FL=1